MRSDVGLFVGILIFFFVLWVYSGGPNKPFSFSGPYITPITNISTSQIGYGPSANDAYRGGNTSSGNTNSGQAFWSRWTSSDPSAHVTFGNPSAYAGSVHLERGALGTNDVNTEYLIIRSGANAPVTITGWQLVGTKSGSHAVITQGTLIADPAGRITPVPIVLSPGAEAIVTSGRSPFGASFLETACTGYLSRNAAFNPALGTRCPYPTDDLRAHYAGSQQWEFNQCADFLSGVSSCRVPNTDTTRLPASCQQFIDTNLNYSGCIANHRTDTGFLGTTWRIYLAQSSTLWRTNETIELLDATGKVVDEYSY